MEVETNKYKARIWDYHGHQSNYEFKSPNDYEAYLSLISNGFGNYGHDDVLWRVEKDDALVEIDTKNVKPMEIKYTLTNEEVRETINLVQDLNRIIEKMYNRSYHFGKVINDILINEVKLTKDEMNFRDKLCKLKRLKKSTFKIENGN